MLNNFLSGNYDKDGMVDAHIHYHTSAVVYKLC